MYKINLKSYSSVFALPTEIADKHLRMAGKAQLKVLLWLYRNPAADIDIKLISSATGIPTDEIDDAMLYWIEAGLIEKDGKKTSETITAEEKFSASPVIPVAPPVSAVPEIKKEKTPPLPPAKPSTAEKPPIVKPSVADIARRLEESPEVRSMFDEAQETFGRTLGYDAQSSLLILHDHYSLPAEVIIMICAYAKTIGKQGSLSYIMRIGASWAQQEINTFDAAADKIARMENADRLWNEFKRQTGLENPKATAKQSEYLETWASDYGFGADVICYAYERAVEKKGSISFPYMNGILRSWRESGLKTIEEIERAELEYAAGTEKTKKNKKQSRDDSDGNRNSPPPSFDVELALKRSLELDPTKTKKGQ